ncbi:hypothetical protein KC19_2G085200 [Ceratodon purpureus]|uniref:Uncharacterized protein n=1 Tax=Ceratodon purpureus TaxID=3225 RepID=A0A8T0IUL2_CERPU|nr:hypothetical protein KC19_2G085200 [Ceratodon purpureus]
MVSGASFAAERRCRCIALDLAEASSSRQPYWGYTATLPQSSPSKYNTGIGRTRSCVTMRAEWRTHAHFPNADKTRAHNGFNSYPTSTIWKTETRGGYRHFRTFGA